MVTKHEIKDVKKISPHDISGQKVGTTTNSYVNALDLETRGQERKLMILKNTHATYGLKYKLLVRAMFLHGSEVEEVAETTLAAAGTVKLAYRQAYGEMKLQVKSAVAGSHATYTADYTMQGV